MSLDFFQNILGGPLLQYLSLSKQLGHPIMYQSLEVKAALRAQYKYISKENGQLISLSLMKRLVSAIQKICRENKGNELDDHMSMIAESISALGWIEGMTEPAQYVKEMRNTAMYYGNRVLTNYRNSTEHVDWVKAWLGTLDILHSFIQKYHPTGFREKNELNMDELSLNEDDVEAGCGDGNRESQNEDFNRIRIDISSKNVTREPIIQQEGKKWMVMDYKNKHDLVIDIPKINNAVYMFRCYSTHLSVKGKLTSITVDSCKKTSLIFDSTISSVEIINCESLEVQVIGRVPTVIVEKTDGCQLYLSNESLDTEIISSRSTQVNVLVPYELHYKEFALPEQIKSVIDLEDGKIKSQVLENKA